MVEKLAQPTVDLRQETYELLKSRVRKPTSFEQQELQRRGWVFVDIAPESLNQLFEKYRSSWPYFEHIHGGEEQPLRTSVPDAITVGIYTTDPIPNSLGKSQTEQLEMIAGHGREVLRDVPDATAVMLSAAAYAQADIAYYQRKAGQHLIREGVFIRCLDKTSRDFTADVGRRKGGFGLVIDDSSSDPKRYPTVHGDADPQALPVAVFTFK